MVTDLRPDAPVFVNQAGRRLSPANASRQWRRLCDSAEVRTIRLHDARHSVATALLDRQVPVHQVAALLGHSTPVTTHATYSHVVDSVGEAVASVMEDVLDGEEDGDQGRWSG
jgi:integrase